MSTIIGKCSVKNTRRGALAPQHANSADGVTDVTKMPSETGPRKGLGDFIAGVRARYAEKKKNLSPNDNKFRPSPIWFFLATISLVLLMQNLFRHCPCRDRQL